MTYVVVLPTGVSGFGKNHLVLQKSGEPAADLLLPVVSAVFLPFFEDSWIHALDTLHGILDAHFDYASAPKSDGL